MRIDRTYVELPVLGRHTVDWDSLSYFRDITGFPLKCYHQVKPAAESKQRMWEGLPFVH